MGTERILNPYRRKTISPGFWASFRMFGMVPAVLSYGTSPPPLFCGAEVDLSLVVPLFSGPTNVNSVENDRPAKCMECASWTTSQTLP